MIFRTVAGIAALYVWGNPVLDGYRPQELDAPAAAVRELLKPTVTKAQDTVYRYLPEQVKYAHVNHPLSIVDARFGGATQRRID